MTAVRAAQATQFAETDLPINPVVPGEARRALNLRFAVEDGNDVALGHVLRPSWGAAFTSSGLS